MIAGLRPALLGLLACGAALAAVLASCEMVPDPGPDPDPGTGPSDYDPLAYAEANLGGTENLEAVIPAQCYTKTDGVSNPCWTCHTRGNGKNSMDDVGLQLEYAFSDIGLTNHWTNLFADRSAAMAAITDSQALAYIRQDNYAALRAALEQDPGYPGWVPDLDFAQGFDAEGFARDGSWWRAFRYKPFLGTFWPTNGSTDDVIIRLPQPFYTDEDGSPSYEIYKVNLAILEAAMTVQPAIDPAALEREVEPLNEQLAGLDLDGDNLLETGVTRIVGLPVRYVGAARGVDVSRFLYPEGTEFLHTVRYVDPDSPTLLSRRMKEVRYSRKYRFLEDDAVLVAYLGEEREKDLGNTPVFGGDGLTGLTNSFGWRLQGFIEDAEGRLRVQSDEETRFCMGCHSTVGVTADQTFGFPRKVPGAAGWGHQDLAGIEDVPQVNHPEPEILTYFERVGGGDEFRANREILDRFFPGGILDTAEVMRAAPGGDRDIRHLIVPSRERAIALNKAYMTLVAEQSFERGRDAVLAPTVNVHESIVNGSTDLAASGLFFEDGRIWLDWDWQP